jgi:hypothetical protein
MMMRSSVYCLMLALQSIAFVLAPVTAGADTWLYGGVSNYASDPLRDSGYYAGVSAFESYEKLDVEVGLGWSTLAYRPDVVQNATTTTGNLMFAMAPDPGMGTGAGSGSGSGVARQSGIAPGFGSTVPANGSGGTGTGNGSGQGGIRLITVTDLSQFDLTLALGRTLGSHHVRGGLHWISANESAIDGNYSGFLDWQYNWPHAYFVRLGLATGERLDGEIQANQYELTAGTEFGNPVLGGVWQLQLNYLAGVNDWSGVGSYTADSVEAAATWSKGVWRLQASAWAGERMYALLKRGYYLITQQDLLTGGYLLGASYRMGPGSLQLFYEFTRLEPAATTESELSTIGIQYQRGFM